MTDKIIISKKPDSPQLLIEQRPTLWGKHIYAINSSLADRLKKTIGFRNLAVHNYHDLNWDIVFAVASKTWWILRSLRKGLAMRSPINSKDLTGRLPQ